MSEYSTSYTAHRGALNDFIKTYTWEREAFNTTWNKPVLKEIAMELILEGAIDAPGFFSGGAIIQEAYLKGVWLGPVPGVINPLQEINAKEKSVANMFSLRSDEMFNLTGMDYEDVLAMWQEEETMFKTNNTQKQAEAVATQDEQNIAQDTEPQKAQLQNQQGETE
jgi:capsid protein